MISGKVSVRAGVKLLTRFMYRVPEKIVWPVTEMRPCWLVDVLPKSRLMKLNRTDYKESIG